MKYFVEQAEATAEVEITGSGATTGPGDQPMATLEPLAVDGAYLLRVGDAVHTVLARRGDERGRYVVSLSGHTFRVTALDERSRAIRALTAAATRDAGPRPLVAPMPGLIVKIQVQIGDEVVPGQPLISMEAMKMENELRAPSAGRVTAIRVAPNEAVEKGAVLVELA